MKVVLNTINHKPNHLIAHLLDIFYHFPVVPKIYCCSITCYQDTSAKTTG